MTEKSAIHIMVVDDEPFMLKLQIRALSNLGFHSVFAYEGAQPALEAMDLSSKHPDLILLDLNMPDIDGIEFVRLLVKRKYLGSLVLVSGEDERMLQAVDKLARAHQITALGYLRKPVRPDMLSALLDKWSPTSRHKPVAVKRHYTLERLRKALDNDELINYYQPKVSLLTAQVVGVEVLVRWRHPDDGLVFPDEFIGVAEAGGMIGALTQGVIARAFSHAKEWQRETGQILPMAINVSMDDLGSLEFADYIAGAADVAGVPADKVTMEVTESRLMRDLRVPLEVLTRLRLKRFRISIDDFGTGHSSLAQLRDMPFDELKIDKGFVHRAWGDETLRAIFQTSVLLARQLNMQIVTEGVEDRADWDFVRRSRCNTAQGYFIAKPMPAENLHDWVLDWEDRALTVA